jgi:hypothetical protein
LNNLFNGDFLKTGPRPAGRSWTLPEEAELRELIASKVKVGQIAKKLKRSPLMADRGWKRPFDEPIQPPKGK